MVCCLPFKESHRRCIRDQKQPTSNTQHTPCPKTLHCSSHLPLTPRHQKTCIIKFLQPSQSHSVPHNYSPGKLMRPNPPVSSPQSNLSRQSHHQKNPSQPNPASHRLPLRLCRFVPHTSRPLRLGSRTAAPTRGTRTLTSSAISSQSKRHGAPAHR